MSVASPAIPSVANGEPLPLSDVPTLPFDAFAESLAMRLNAGEQLAALFGTAEGTQNVRLWAVTSDSVRAGLSVFATDVADSYPSLTNRVPQAHWFEREIAEQWGVVPEGHPWLKPIRFVRSYRDGHDAWGRGPDNEILPCVQPEGTEYYRIEGEEIHEVAVGPIHAGVIEPGHFRFQCHGEHVFHLEIEHGFQHRGVERALSGGPTRRTLHYMETLAGDTTAGHTTAYCQAIEALSGTHVPIRAQVLRGIVLELERLANHTGDLGALGQDIGFLPTASFCGRLRGDFLNTTALLCGNRYGRGLVRPGGVRFDVDEALREQMAAKVETTLKDVRGAVELLWSASSVTARFEETGAVDREVARSLGLVGMAARACGLDRDVRRDFPLGIYQFSQLPVSTWHNGDVFARAYVRWLEVQRSGRFVLDHLHALPTGPVQSEADPEPLQPETLVVSLVEGWRGEICHVAMTDGQGRFSRYKVVDPSFHNWIGLMMSLRDQQISDFPLCNKSFNLSYCGHDL